MDNRYIRQVSLPQVGQNGQDKLKNASVLIIGAGGLGHASLPYLASSGIGTIGIIDGDIVSQSNLHRQILFSEQDIDQLKSKVASEKLKNQFPETNIESYSFFLDADNALDIFKNYDLIVDATDSIDIRYLINDVCALSEKAFVHASVFRFQFQISVFNFKNSGTYRCLYPTAPQNIQSCAEAGVMPTTVALAGLYQANEVLKYFLGIGELLTNKLLIVNTLTNKQDIFKYQKNEDITITKASFDAEHGITFPLISYKEAVKKEGLFLDVRNFDELPKVQLDNLKRIPLTDLSDNFDTLKKDQSIFIFCQSGKRSRSAAKILTENNFKHIYCLSENASEIEYEKN